MKINREKFLEALNQLENHQNNKANKSLQEAKEALEKIIRGTELLLRESNSEFEESLINSGINFESDIFEKIEELNSKQEVKEKEQEIFSNFFTFYYFSLVEEEAVPTNDRRKVEMLISILEAFRERKISTLATIYQENEEKIEDTIATLKAISLSLDEPKKEEKVIPSSSKGKEPEKSIEPSSQNSLIDIALKKVNKDNIIELQKQVIKEKEEEIKNLKEELAAEREKVAKLSAELENLQKEKLESKTEIPPKK